MKRRGVVLTPWERKCVGILWILSFASVNSCPDRDNATMTCDLLPVDGLNCTYVKGVPKDPPTDSYRVPSAVENLNASTGYQLYNGKCETRLNITWNVRSDGSLDYLRGFFLTYKFNYKNGTIFLNRTFSVGAVNWQNAAKTNFRHDCVVPVLATLYEITVYSLPMRINEAYKAKVDYRTASNATAVSLCDRTGEPKNSAVWIAYMWSVENPLLGTIDVCFFTAPPTYNFTLYAVSLLRNGYNPLGITVQKKIISVDVNKDLKVCWKFMNVCSGVYNIWVMPVNDPRCTCQVGGECRGSCTATVVESINMTASTCTSTTTSTTSPTTFTDPIKWPVSLSSSPDAPDPSPGGAKLAGILVGVLLAVGLVAVVAILLYCRICHQRPDVPVDNSKEPKTEFPAHPVDDEQTVLLVYSSDNEHHRKVVRYFAAFLHSCCKCDVRFDDWSQVDISQTNALDWLTRQLHQVKHIIIINSLGAYMQHKAWIEGATCRPVKELLLPDMFIPALRQIQARAYDSRAPLHYYHIYFPYTDARHLLGVSFGQRYRLMKRVEDLFLNIHGMTKHSPKGKTSASQINADRYASSVEGRALRAAIDDACAGCRANPNWFADCYSYRPAGAAKEVTLVKYGPVNGDIPPSSVNMRGSGNDSSSRPSSLNSTNSNRTTKSSDEGLHSTPPEVLSPSPVGSSDYSELEPWRVSFDMGIETGLDDSSLDPNSPTAAALGFCPPPADDDDDDEEEASSIGSRVFFQKLDELNEQYDSGIPFSSFEFRGSNRSSC